MDVKKLGRIADGGGWRAHGRSAGDTAARMKARIGFDYVHSLVDDHSRLAYSEIHPGEKGATCASFLARVAAYFRGHGIARIERVMTDNHFSYRRSNDVRDVLPSLGVKHVLIRPHCPWQNGKVERLNRTLYTERAYRQVFTSNDQRSAALAPWIEHYNTQRYHSAIGGTHSAGCHQPDCRVQLERCEEDRLAGCHAARAEAVDSDPVSASGVQCRERQAFGSEHLPAVVQAVS